MKEHMKDEQGLRTLGKEELTVTGGVSFRGIMNLIKDIGIIVDTIEKYWPDFADGFRAGWEAA